MAAVAASPPVKHQPWAVGKGEEVEQGGRHLVVGVGEVRRIQADRDGSGGVELRLESEDEIKF